MSKQQFRALVIINQILLIGGLFVGELSDNLLPPEMRSTSGASVLDESEDGAFNDVGLMLDYALIVLTVVSAIALCLWRRWGRTLFLLCTVGAVLMNLTIHYSYYSSTGLGSAVGYLTSLTEGAILALAYFSHLARMFKLKRNETHAVI